MDKAKPDWKEFEALVERLQRAFHPNATITRNDHLMGNESARSREIDISIRYKLGTTDLLLVVDCKKRSRKIDLPEMHSFIGLKSDVQAHAGIMICDRGFSKPAARVAARNNIECLTLLDTEKPEWKCRVKIPVVIEEWLLIPTIFRLLRKDGSQLDMSDVDLTETNTSKKFSPAEVVQKLWDEHPQKVPGPVCYEIAVGEETAALDEKLRVGFDVRVQRFTRRAYLALVGLTNVRDGLTYTDKMKIATTAEPEIVSSSEDRFAGIQGFPLGFFLKTTAVQTAQSEYSRLNLKKNYIELSLGSSAKPISIRLSDAK